MLKENRKELNRLIERINYFDKLLKAVVKKDTYNKPSKFDQDYSFACDNLNGACDYFLDLSDKLFYRNLDKDIQTSVNYYRRKAGMKPYKITALF